MIPFYPCRPGPVIYWASVTMRLVLSLCLWFLACAMISGQVCSISVEHTDAICFGEPTGTINITVSGGLEPYQFSWTGPGSFTCTDQNLSGLGAGTYTVVVSDAGGICQDTTTITIGQPDHPMVFSVQPLDQTDCYGNTVEFSAQVDGFIGPVSYQWQSRPPSAVEFNDISTATSPVLVIHDIGVSGQNIHGTEYRLIASDNCSTIASETALLEINTVTGLTGSVNLTICSCSDTSYEVSTRGNVTAYQWSFNDGTGWQPIKDNITYSGSTTQRLTISEATPLQTGAYRVSVTFTTLNQPESFPVCVVTTHSRNRNLMVMPLLVPPVISSDQVICQGETPAPLTATSSTGGSGPPFSYQWQFSTDNVNWIDLTGEQGLSYAPPPLQTTTWYRIAVTDEGPMNCGTAYAFPAAIVVNPLPGTSAIYHN